MVTILGSDIYDGGYCGSEKHRGKKCSGYRDEARNCKEFAYICPHKDYFYISPYHTGNYGTQVCRICGKKFLIREMEDPCS